MSKNIIGAWLAIVVVTGCAGKDSMTGAISNVFQSPDWSGKVCESPIYQEIIGSYQGELTFATGSRLCRWDTTVVVSGESLGDDCTLSGHAESNLLEQGAQQTSAYVCDSGKHVIKYANGLGVGDDLDSIRPISIVFQFLPVQEEQDSNGTELVHPIVQFENMTVEYEGLLNGKGSLLVRQ